MKRKNASLLGNVLMGLGLVVMVVGVGYSILNQLPQFNLPQFFAHGAVLSIFVGAILWLAGARVGGMNKSATATGGCAITTNVAAVTIIVVTVNVPCKIMTSQHQADWSRFAISFSRLMSCASFHPQHHP